MQAFNFYLSDALSQALVLLILFIVIKILSPNVKLHPINVLYGVIASVLISFISHVNISLHYSASVFIPVLGDHLLLIFFGLIYFYKFAKHSVKTSIVAAEFSCLIPTIAMIIAYNFVSLQFFAFIQNENEILIFILTLLLLYTISIFISLIIKNLFQKIIRNISKNKRLQLILILCFAAINVYFMVYFNFQQYQTAYIEMFSTQALLMTIYTVLIFAVFCIYAYYQEKKFALLMKEQEQKTFQDYTLQLETQQLAMRRFKHDYQNILISIDSFLEEDDLAGLKTYYNTKIKAASEVITKSDFALDGLSKIKLPEIKSVLLSKLMMAQNLGINVTFEAHEDIDHINVDSIALLRALGIILDNAIEELTALGRGKLTVACFNEILRGGG